jgi:hypothetical protein
LEGAHRSARSIATTILRRSTPFRAGQPVSRSAGRHHDKLSRIVSPHRLARLMIVGEGHSGRRHSVGDQIGPEAPHPFDKKVAALLVRQRKISARRSGTCFITSEIWMARADPSFVTWS